jgi:hypothetical protein
MQHDIAADKTVEQPLDKARVRADPDDNRFPERAFSIYRLQPLSEVPGKTGDASKLSVRSGPPNTLLPLDGA